MDVTEDPAAFSDAGLAGYDVVIWLSTSGDVLVGRPEGRLRAVHPRRPRLRGYPPGRQAPSTTGPGTADSSAPISATTRASSTRSSRSRRSTSRTAERGHEHAAGASGPARRSGTASTPTPGPTSTSCSRSTSVRTTLAATASRAARRRWGITRSPGVGPTTAAGRSTPRSATRGCTGSEPLLLGACPRRHRDGRGLCAAQRAAVRPRREGAVINRDTASGRRPRGGLGR